MATGRAGFSLLVAMLAMCTLVGCSQSGSDVERAQAQVAAKEKALTEAQAAAKSASDGFCHASKTYIEALDRYADVLTDTAPTVGDVTTAGADLSKPRDAAFDGAEAAVEAQQKVDTAAQDLAAAQTALAKASAGPTGSPATTVTPPPTSEPLVPAATVDRVKKADEEFTAAQQSITDQTTLADASQRFNSAAVALEFAWLRLFAEAGCVPDAQTAQAQEAVTAYVTALQNDLAAAGYYGAAVDGIYGPQTVAAVEELQKASGLPVTGAVDKATAAALQAKLVAQGGATAQQESATTAAIQQTLKLAGYWDGAVDGIWTPALTEALQALQAQLGVPQSGVVDAATVSAFEKAVAQAKQPSPAPTPSAAPSP